MSRRISRHPLRSTVMAGRHAPPRPLAEGNQSPYEVNGVLYTVSASAQGYRSRAWPHGMA